MSKLLKSSKSAFFQKIRHIIKMYVFPSIIGLALGLLFVMTIYNVKAQSPTPSTAVFVQPSVGAPNGNPNLYIDTGNVVSLSRGKIEVNPENTTIPSGLDDRTIVTNYSDTAIGSLGAIVQSFVDGWTANLGVRDKFWVDYEDNDSSVFLFGSEKALSLSDIGTPIYPIAPANTIDTHPKLVHGYVAHGEVGAEKKLCADAFGYIQLCDEPVPTTHQGYTCGNGSFPPNENWYGPSTAIVDEPLCASGVTYGSTNTNAVDCKIVYPNQAPPSGALCVNTKCNVAVGNTLPIGATCENGSNLITG